MKPFFAGTWNFDTQSFENLEQTSSSDNLGVDPGYKSPGTDQYILSLEREIVKGLGAQLNYVYKRGRDYPAWKEIAGTYDRIPFTDDLGDNPTGRTFDIYQLTSDPSQRQFRITNPAGVGSDVNAVSFDVLKRMTGKWQLNASVTWLKATGQVQESASGVTIQQRSGLQFRSFGT